MRWWDHHQSHLLERSLGDLNPLRLMALLSQRHLHRARHGERRRVARRDLVRSLAVVEALAVGAQPLVKRADTQISVGVRGELDEQRLES